MDEERARATALASELATAQREIETQAAQLHKASGDTEQFRKATESAMTELRQSLQEARARTEAIAREVKSTRQTTDVHATSEAVANVSKVTPVIEVVAMAPPVAVEAQGGRDATRLIARARALLGQGNIGAARVVLERAAETGSAQATFALAETYDPNVLATWRTFGTRGDVMKARDLYARAYDGGIRGRQGSI